MPLATERPHVVIVGGFLTEPLAYGRMRQRLLDRGAAQVTVTPLHLPDWLAVAFAGMRPATLRTIRTIREARRTSEAPLIVVGHSAGGILSRLAMSPQVLDGRLPERRRGRGLPGHAGDAARAAAVDAVAPSRASVRPSSWRERRRAAVMRPRRGT